VPYLIHVGSASGQTGTFQLLTSEDGIQNCNASVGRIVVNNDERTLTDLGFVDPNDAAQFVENLTGYFTGGAPGSFLAYSDNLGLTGSLLAQTMSDLGHDWLVSTAVPFTLEELHQHDGVFLGGIPADNGVLVQYVNTGGNVYLMGGTGFGVMPPSEGSDEEAAAWAPLLNECGLAFDGVSYNGIVGSIAVDSEHPLINGSSVLDLEPSNPANAVILELDGQGLFAVYDTDTCPPDVTADGVVDVLDLTAIIVVWGTDDPAADGNEDGIVDVQDLTALILDWGPCE
jgi:hypothetical protein